MTKILNSKQTPNDCCVYSDWMQCERMVDALWTVSVNGAKLNGEPMVNAQRTHGEQMQKLESSTFYWLYT